MSDDSLHDTTTTSSAPAPSARRFRLNHPVLAYALYDAGNSNYVTLIPSLAFPLFFREFVAREARWADAAYGAMIVAATLLAAALAPWIGARVDCTGGRIAWLRLATWIAVAGTALLPLASEALWAVGVVFVLTQTCFLLGTVLYDSALADVASRGNAARISSIAWAAGYAGGIVGLALSLGLEKSRSMFAVAAALFFTLSLPLVLARRSAPAAAPREKAASWLSILRDFMRDPARARMFWAFFLYSNGVTTVIYFTTLYAATTMGYSFRQTLWLFIAMNAVAAPAAVLFGWIAERKGQLRTLKWVVGAWVVVVIGVMLADPTSFAIIACLAAALIGPVQALSRSLFRVLFPEGAMSSFFGVQALASRGSALVGPLLFGAVSSLTGSQRLGALTALALFAAGLLMLLRVPRDAERQETDAR